MADTSAVYYRNAKDVEPVDEFIESLAARRQVVIDSQIDRLNGLDPAALPLPFPHTSQVDGELRELRCHYGSEQYRVLYRRSGNLFILLHAFRKTTAKIPLAEIQTARERWEDFKQRMDAPRRQKPRAAGHDAP
jgi:phage-related protein